jgi:hypothetical protein
MGNWHHFEIEESSNRQSPKLPIRVLYLMWQIVGLTYFLYAGSPHSREGEDRKEERLDYILRKLDLGHRQKLS